MDKVQTPNYDYAIDIIKRYQKKELELIKMMGELTRKCIDKGEWETVKELNKIMDKF